MKELLGGNGEDVAWHEEVVLDPPRGDEPSASLPVRLVDPHEAVEQVGYQHWNGCRHGRFAVLRIEHEGGDGLDEICLVSQDTAVAPTRTPLTNA